MRVYNLRPRKARLEINTVNRISKIKKRRPKVKEGWILSMNSQTSQPLQSNGPATSQAATAAPVVLVNSQATPANLQATPIMSANLQATPGGSLDINGLGSEPPVGTSSPHPFNMSITPLGGGANHTLVGIEPTPPTPLHNMDQDMANSILENIEFEIDGLDDITFREGWIGDLERHVQALSKQLVDHKVQCRQLGFTDTCDRATKVLDDLNATANRLRTQAGVRSVSPLGNISVAAVLPQTLTVPQPGSASVSAFPSFDEEENALNRVKRMRKKIA